MPVIDNLQVRATGDVAAAERSIDRLITKLRQLQTVGSQINSTPQSTGENAVAEAVKNYKQLRQTLSKIQKIGHDTLFSESAFQQIQHLSMELVDLSYSAQRALVAMDALRDSGTMIITPDAIEGLKATVEKLSDSINRLADKKMKAKKAADDMAKSTKKLGNTAKSASGGISKLFAAIKRVVVYRMLRGAIKAITTALREGVENLYQWATANQDAFKQVMDTYATRTNYLKNTLGALAANILTALLPVFLQVTNAIITAINYVSEFIAAMTGQDDYLRAKEVMVEYGDAAEDAAASQKKLNQQLMEFDELNVITTPKDNAKKATDNQKWNDAFELKKVSDWMKGNWKNVLGTAIAGVIALSVGKGLVAGLLGETAMAGIASCAGFLKNALAVAAGITIMVAGITFAWDAGGKLSGDDVFGGMAEAIGSALAAGLGGSLVGATFGAAGFGFVIGAELSILATIAGFLLNRDTGKKMIGWAGEEAKTVVTTGSGSGTKDKPITPSGIATINWFGDVFSPNKNKTTTTYSGSGVASGYFQSESYMRMMEGYASGGYPSMGSVFVAGEIPGQAEMVGNINGRTGVASGEEITGISEAVYSTGGETNALLRELISVAASGNGKPNAAFGKFVSQSLNLYKGVTG